MGGNYTFVDICILNIFWLLDEVCVLDGLYDLDGAYPVDVDYALDEDYILDGTCMGGAGVFFVLGGYRVVERGLYVLIGCVLFVFRFFMYSVLVVVIGLGMVCVVLLGCLGVRGGLSFGCVFGFGCRLCFGCGLELG